MIKIRWLRALVILKLVSTYQLINIGEIILKLFLKVDEDGCCEGHPYTADGVKTLNPNHDFKKGLPAGWARLIRTPKPILGPYQKFDSCGQDNCNAWSEHNGLVYERQPNGFFQEVWKVREMTPEEKQEKQEKIKKNFDKDLYPSWIFNEKTCRFEPPIPYPSDGRDYKWNEAEQKWKFVVKRDDVAENLENN